MSQSNKIDWESVYEQLHRSEQQLAEVLSPNPDRVRRIQAERAARLASRRKAAEIETTIPMLIVEVAGERIAIKVTSVSEVMPLIGLTHVPGTDASSLGVINLRGELYNVMDTRAFLRSQRAQGETAWGVALRHPALRVMLGVDAVLRIENVPSSALDAAEDNVLRVQDEIAILLDTPGILERLEAGLASVANPQDQ